MISQTGRRQQWRLWLGLAVLGLCALVGMGLGAIAAPDFSGTVDVLPLNAQLGAQIYLRRCGTCHLALPPETMPAEAWQVLIQDTNHYGATLPPIPRPEMIPLWNYLRTYSRALGADAQIPFRVGRSPFFRILHPRVELPEPVTFGSCSQCHPKATLFNFRELTPEWQHSP
ncbi:cytochrome C [Parathermosynechococcus lividus PCC 6715]|uniref:Cytochrome C n=1 Tax=Parathermosynechococcus lividus PCC 6715 TaxID=1917166 RepID=A0A2D2Q380_PARLV|nr:cytochrome C [Thermostichus lividus]ATS18717.1 cytochrome C [Thermostichus lividus PCC 6715]